MKPVGIDRLQHYQDPEQALRVAQDALQARLWTMIPCFVESYDAAKNLAVLQPAVKGLQQLADGSFVSYDYALLGDVIVQFPGGGGFSLTFPLAKGDEVMAFFACRNVNGWYATGQVSPEPSIRTHDISDGFCVPRVWSKPNVIPAISAENVQLRNDAGDTYVEIDPSGNVNVVATGDVTAQAGGDANIDAGGNISATAVGDVTIEAGGNVEATAVTAITLTAPLITLAGAVVATSTIAATSGITSNAGTHSLSGHHHTVSGVQSGSSTIATGTTIG